MSLSLTPAELALLRLTMLPGVGSTISHALLEDFDNHPERIFEATADELAQNPAIRPSLARLLRSEDSLHKADEELRTLSERAAAGETITPLFYGEEGYPEYLLNCADAPLVLYAKGTLPTDGPMIAIVGTRRCTTYAADVLERMVKRWAELRPDLIIVSGLAYGVDALAHRAALKHGLRSVGVVAHGHYTLYPSRHRDLAAEMIHSGGGVVTEYGYHTRAFPQHFVLRNRIVAGMTRATVVVESARRGGALITAGLALDYGRSVFAVPGRIFDSTSEGCNWLLASERAACLADPDFLLEELSLFSDRSGVQRLPFSSETEEGEEDPILRELREAGPLTLNDLTLRLGEQAGALSGRLFELELSGKVRSLPGALYERTM
ncbi:DNA-processing protein DprA [uncultured Porphyromonas sp.]|uniref:DNA-processing protein DprA n=1 Tax=uncultured Porphyromonas sp. TaxID=159274 RepID=UPI002632E8F7|nr:DNA-processing protein DprA [uncultured Porphyromonas sp.]